MEFKKILSSGLQIRLEVFEIRLMRVTWPMPLPFSRFFFAGFLIYCHSASVYQISSLYLSSLWRYVRVYAKIFGGHVSYAGPLFRIFLCGFWDIAPENLYTKFQVSTSTRFEYTLGLRQKFWGSRDVGHAPFLNFSSRVFEILPMCTCLPNFKSLALVFLEIR